MVQVYDNIIPVEFCEELISIFENSEDKQEYMNNNYKPCFTQLNLNQHFPNLAKSLVKITQKVYAHYCVDVKNPYIPRLKQLEEFRLKRYLSNTNERFDEHIDVTDYASARRALAFLFYLNDNNGYTDFPFQSLNIIPQTGRALVFPPTWEYPHTGISPTDHSKYILSTYIHYG